MPQVNALVLRNGPGDGAAGYKHGVAAVFSALWAALELLLPADRAAQAHVLQHPHLLGREQLARRGQRERLALIDERFRLCQLRLGALTLHSSAKARCADGST